MVDETQEALEETAEEQVEETQAEQDQVEEILDSIEWIAEENEEHMKVLISAYYALRDQNGYTIPKEWRNG